MPGETEGTTDLVVKGGASVRLRNVPRASTLVVAGVTLVALMASGAVGADGKSARGRWIFRYDRSGDQPPVGRAQPDFVGVVTELTETRTRQWRMRVRVEALDGARRTIMVTESTRVDGEPAKKTQHTLARGVPLAVFGQEVRGEFHATALFVISEDDWSEIVADARPEAGQDVPTPPAGTAEVPTRYEWREGREDYDTDLSDFPWPARRWEPRYPILEVTAPERARRSSVASPMERVRRADFSGAIRSIRSGGRELSVTTAGAVIVVTLDERTTIRRDGAIINPDKLREGDMVDVAVGLWRGTESCIAKQLWVVTQDVPAAP